jgi:SAM-dependent methyltransferase
MPDPEVQLQYTGNSGDAVLREAFHAYLLFRDMYTTHVGPIEECSAVLDFGCGWGRILRFFLKDLDSSRLWAADPSEAMVAFCRSNFPGCHIEHIDPQPPGPFPDESFDLIYAYSVFSHLSEDMHHRCLTELTRILRPGGVLVATTRPRSFVDDCAAMRKRKDLSTVHAGPTSSAAAFPDPTKALSDYDAGRYCYSQLVFEGTWTYWGEAAISEDYVAKNWTRHLAFVDYIDDRQGCANAIVMQKPGG